MSERDWDGFDRDELIEEIEDRDAAIESLQGSVEEWRADFNELAARLRAPVNPPERVSEQGLRRGPPVKPRIPHEDDEYGSEVERVSEASALRDFVQEIADEGCAYSYPDGCPNGGTRKAGECESCRARRALEDTKGDG